MGKPNWLLRGLAIFLVFSLGACSGGSGDGEDISNISENTDTSESSNENTTVTGSTAAIVLSGNTNGRLLASNCYQCHGTNGIGGFDRIYKSNVLSDLREFASGAEGSGIMAAHAQGFTDAQMQSIASYLANP